MKAIIISDNNNTIDTLDKTLVENGYSTIIYKWLLKALDNIEEIRPDLVIVSVNEYPRHWKTLTQFVASGIGGEKTKVILLCQTPLSDDEQKKATALGVSGFFSGIDEAGISELLALLNSNNPVPSKAIKAESKKVEEEPEVIFDVADAVMLFTNPHSGKAVTGTVVSYKSKVVEFKPEYKDVVFDLRAGDEIEYLTFELDSKIQNYVGSVIKKADNVFIKLVSEING